MTAKEFNLKWEDHLEIGNYGLEFDEPEMVEYLDRNFEVIKRESPNFTYSQIKFKFGKSRVYMNGIDWEEISVLEHQLNKMHTEIRNRKAHVNS